MEHTAHDAHLDGTDGEGAPGSHHDHGGHHDHGSHAEMFRRLFWINLVLALPVVFFSPMIQDWFGYTAPHFPGSTLVAPVFGSIVFFYGGWPFLSGGWTELRNRQPGMMLLIAMAISVAYGASLATELDLFDVDFWWELAALIVIMLLGHWQEMKAIGEAQGALAALAELLPDEAERVTDTGVEAVSIHRLRLGDLVLVRSGGRIPADGVVVHGEAEVDEAMVTGESRPVPKGPGDHVVAGTVATDSSLRVHVEAVGDDTALAGIQRLVAEAQASRSRAQALADRAAALLFYVAISAAVVTAIVWSLLGDSDQAIECTVTVLVIACPHALGLAIPLVISLSSAIAARNGILVKDRLALERMRVVDTVLFDKTGTLTRGAHVVTGVAAVSGHDQQTVLRLAAAAEADSEHPLARAIVKAAADVGNVPAATRFRSLTGRGVEAEVDGHQVAVGGPAMLRQLTLTPPAALRVTEGDWSKRGAAVLSVVVDGQVAGSIGLEDEIRPESREAVEMLHAQGVHVVMITGDAVAVADAVGQELGVDEVFAEVLPEAKEHSVAELQGRGRIVAMVGDGVNDAPALARADVGIAIGAGTDVAIESAGVVLAPSDPRLVVSVIRLSKASYRKMVENLAWGAGYNVIAIPLAAGALAWAGFTLAPALGAMLMSLSTIVVALKRAAPAPGRSPGGTAPAPLPLDSVIALTIVYSIPQGGRVTESLPVDVHRPSQARALRKALAALCVTEITSWGVLYYAFPVVADSVSADTGWSRSAVAAAFSVSLLVAAGVGVPVGRWLDRHGPRPVMTIGSALAVPSVLAIASAPNLLVFVLAWVVAGAAMSAVLYQPAFAALTRWYGDRRVAALTTLTLAAGFSSTIFAPLTGLILGRTTWRTTYVVLAVVLAVVTIPLHLVQLRPPWPRPPTRGSHGQHDVHDDHNVVVVVRSASFRYLAVAFALASFAAFAVVFNTVPLLTTRGLSTELAAFALGLGGVGQVLGRLAYRRLADGTSVRVRTMALLVTEGLAIAVLGVVPGPAGLLVARTLVVGAIRGSFTLLQATAITDRWGVQQYATLNGILAVPVTAAMAMAPWAGAALASMLGSYPRSFVAFAVVCWGAGFLAWFSVADDLADSQKAAALPAR